MIIMHCSVFVIVFSVAAQTFSSVAFPAAAMFSADATQGIVPSSPVANICASHCN